MRTKTLKIAALASIPLLGLGWYLFRPELLFVNEKVNESAPAVQGQSVMNLGGGSFVSYAHQTTGQAAILKSGSNLTLRLTALNTSNGPDVHVYLLKGTDPNAVKDGSYIDLGVLKGNIGDQNYTIPAGTNTSEYGAVSIWCKRFSVNFGGAPLKSDKPVSQVTSSSFSTPNYITVGSEIKVTGGTFKGAKGSASIVEANGQRWVRFSSLGLTKSLDAYLVKAETFPMTGNPTTATSVRLGTLTPAQKTAAFKISKDQDAWLYRTVVLWDPKAKKTVAVSELRSDQERKKVTLLI